MEEDEDIPIELTIDHQMLIKIEMELQDLLFKIENEYTTVDSFDEAINKVRHKIAAFKVAFAKFEQAALEFNDNINFEKKILPIINGHQSFLLSLQKCFQKSSISGQNRIMNITKTELLGNTQETYLKQRKKNGKAESVKTSTDITENLLNIARIMDSQIKQGEATNAALSNSSTMIVETHEEFKGLTGIVNMSHKLLNKYTRREMTDTLLIFFGLVLFFATVLYVISKRL
ncbi:vesicle transport protein SEC20 [Hydra vulgaris]|uniref:Vesicle transport protein SEC20 n=1 Tax=Hydra vulgaris TaxID=6087 RepID=A0ABM4BDB5_HYDVU